MSASEKLKQLKGWSEEDRGWDSGPYGIAERDAAEYLLSMLPEIIAAVEAAQEVTDKTSMIHPAGGLDDLEAALAALNKALA